LPAALESTLLIFGIVLFVLKRNIDLNSNQKMIVYFSLFFSVFLAILIGLATPVLGAIVRYRVPYLPFLYSAIFISIKIPKFTIFNKIETKLCK
jgi:hypothetical protein